MEINKVYCENCLDTMNRMPSDFCDMVLTSPPYDNLRDYKGYSFPFEEIAKELYRVTKPGGVVVWVVGDQTVNGSESGTSFRQALYFMECGFNLHDTMIYHRYSQFPSQNRCRQDFEYMFVFSKGKPSTFTDIRERKTGTKTGGQKKKGRKKSGELEKLDPKTEDRLKKAKHSCTRAKGNVWFYFNGNYIATKDEYAFKHPAIFPEALAKDHIISWSNEGDLVYDPFMGSGTTAKMAILKKRNFIGSEVAKEYIPIIQRRVRDAREAMKQGNLFDQL